MRTVTLAAVVGSSCLFAPALARADERPIRGQVVDTDGKGVADVEVAFAWTASAGVLKPLGGTRTDAQGRFSLRGDYLGEKVTLLAYDAARARGALAEVDPLRWSLVQEMYLHPTTPFTAKISVGENVYPSQGLAWLGTLVSPTVVRVAPDRGEVRLPLPPGEHRLTLDAPGHGPASRDFAVPAPKGGPPKPLDLGDIRLEKRESRVREGEVGRPLLLDEGSPDLDALLARRHLPARWTLLYFWAHT